MVWPAVQAPLPKQARGPPICGRLAWPWRCAPRTLSFSSVAAAFCGPREQGALDCRWRQLEEGGIGSSTAWVGVKEVRVGVAQGNRNLNALQAIGWGVLAPGRGL